MHNYTRRAYMNIPRMVWDGIFTAATFPLALWVSRFIHPDLAWQSLLWMPMLYGLVFMFSMNSHGLYEASTFTYQDRTMRGITASCLLGTLAITLFLFFMPQTRGNTDFLAFFSIGGILVFGLRYFGITALSQRTSKSADSQLLLAGTIPQMQEYLYYLNKTSFRVNPIGFLSELPQDKMHNLQRLGGLEDLSAVLQHHVVDEVVLALPQNCVADVKPYLQECAKRGLLAKVALDVWSADNTKCHVHSVGPIPVLIYHHSNLSSLQHSFKRGFDILLGLAGLCITVLFSLVLVPALLLNHNGSVLTNHNRTGQNGRTFRQYRFRIVAAGKDNTSRNLQDFTGIGRFLFRTKLYYLPSFFNVLKGDMSIVGTRGSLKETADTEHPVSQRPGLTGLWHIRDVDRVLDEDGLQKLDNEYAASWHLLLDLKILLLTPVIYLIHMMLGQSMHEEDTH